MIYDTNLLRQELLNPELSNERRYEILKLLAYAGMNILELEGEYRRKISFIELLEIERQVRQELAVKGRGHSIGTENSLCRKNI